MCFVYFLEQITIISLYSINRLVFFIAETESVSCAVQSESLTLIQANLMKYVGAMSRCRMFKFTNVSEAYSVSITRTLKMETDYISENLWVETYMALNPTRSY